MNIPTEMQLAIQWGSHMPALLACMALTNGPVLELGTGHFSTPYLHALCGALNRDLSSVEQNNDWADEFLKYRRVVYGNGIVPTVSHTILHGAYWDILTDNLNGLSWSVAFIDSSPGGKSRSDLFQHLIQCSEFVVMHDAQKDAENFKAVEPMLEGLNWYLCTSYFPHTLVASKTRKIPEVLIGM